MRSDDHGAFASVKRRVGDLANNRFRCLLEYGNNDLKIGGDGKNCYRALNYFPLVGFSCKVELRVFYYKY